MNKGENPKYFLYTRKSTESEDRQVLSLDSQIEEGLRIAKRENITNVEIIRESKSAKEPGRNQFNDMLERIVRGEAKGIICWHLNRLSRNPIDAGRIQYMLQSHIITQILTPSQIHLPGDNVLMMCIEFGMANQYIRELANNVRRGLHTKNEMGWKTGIAPIGYLNTKQAKGTNTIVEDPSCFILLQKLFKLALDGCSPTKALEIATNEWGLRYKNGTRKLKKSSFYRMLNNPFYYGCFESPLHSGIWYQGKHAPMINEVEYDRIQALLGKKGNTRPKTYAFAFSGLIKCGECGASITAENKRKIQKNGNTHLYTYYHCTKRIKPCSQESIREEDLEMQILELLNRIQIPKEFCQWALDQLRQQNYKEEQDQELIDQNIKKQLQMILQKSDNLLEMRLNGVIDEDTFINKNTEIQKDKTRLNELRKTSEKHIDTWLERGDAIFNFAVTAKESFQNGSLELKRNILTTLGSNFSLLDGKLSANIQKPLILIEEVSEQVKEAYKRLEPLKIPINPDSFESILGNELRKRGWWDSNLFEKNI